MRRLLSLAHCGRTAPLPAALRAAVRGKHEEVFAPSDTFVRRHIGPDDAQIASMLSTVGLGSLEEVGGIVPREIQVGAGGAGVWAGHGESELLGKLKAIAGRNQWQMRSYIGLGYYGTLTPNVILRNLLENPAWYTPYTPYQAEVSQGRLQSLLNFQTMVEELTGLAVANASLLDEATAAAEAMALAYEAGRGKRRTFWVAHGVHPQTLGVMRTRAAPLGIEVVVGALDTFSAAAHPSLMGALVQYPATDGSLHSAPALRAFTAAVRAAGAVPVAATDLLALTLITPPGELGFEVAVGSAQRFGVPMGYGGPHAAFFAVADAHKRSMPGRLIGVSKDAAGKTAFRMALQTREQHIRREKATSNICTAQALLANTAAMYAVYHGPAGLKDIAAKVHAKALLLAAGLARLDYAVRPGPVFDTVALDLPPPEAAALQAHLVRDRFNVARRSGLISVALDETVTRTDLQELLASFASFRGRASPALDALDVPAAPLGELARTSAYLTHPIFQACRSETEMLRYLYELQLKDVGLQQSMIALGSCTMKLNATAEMIPITWPEMAHMHPFVPLDQAAGYQHIIRDLEHFLAALTGFSAVSLQPNAGSQGEYAGLLVIRQYHASRGQPERDVCLIPTSAHGTNPASAAMAGLRVVAVACDAQGNVDVADLKAKAAQHAGRLACLMITYPSTHGVFETAIRDICATVHAHGGQVYMDGANMNAQVGLTSPGFIGADVCHLNLHKTFCIPHGGGGPGMGPIGVAAHLAPFLPSHPVVPEVNPSPHALGPVSAAPWGSADILNISWVYIQLMGAAGLRRATLVALLNANYMARRLEPHYPIVYRGEGGRVAHEFIIDLRPLKRVGIEAEDVAKRLMDYGFHAPTMSFPVAGTLMIEPTESESQAELDRLCEALIDIRRDIADIEAGRIAAADSPLRHAPHTHEVLLAATWDRKYSREKAAYPLPYLRRNKFWPSVSRIDNTYGDRNLICSCPPMDEYM